jgi:hypothetical protein
MQVRDLRGRGVVQDLKVCRSVSRCGLWSREQHHAWLLFTFWVYPQDSKWAGVHIPPGEYLGMTTCQHSGAFQTRGQNDQLDTVDIWLIC